jgi:hypothetical protein
VQTRLNSLRELISRKFCPQNQDQLFENGTIQIQGTSEYLTRGYSNGLLQTQIMFRFQIVILATFFFNNSKFRTGIQNLQEHRNGGHYEPHDLISGPKSFRFQGMT